MTFAFIVSGAVSPLTLAALADMNAMPWPVGGTLLAGRVDAATTLVDRVAQLQDLGLKLIEARPLPNR